MFVDVPDAAGNTQVNMINSTFEYLEKKQCDQASAAGCEGTKFFPPPRRPGLCVSAATSLDQ